MSQESPRSTQLSRHAQGAKQLYPVPRRAHTKSRTGCRNCKKRRVKCDEERPVCDKCSIHYDNIHRCDYGGDDAFENDSSMHKLPEKFPRERGESSAERFRALHIETWQTQTPRSLSPCSLDPFKTHPPTKELDVNLLMHAYFSNQIFKTFPKRNPVLEFFAPLIWKDTVLFHVTLLLSVFNSEKNAPVKERIRSKQLQADCIGLLQERINDTSPDCVSDGTLSAVVGLVAIEHEKGNSRLVQIHMTGLKRILEVRGGLEAVRKSNPTVANILFCIIVATAAEDFPACDLDRPINRPTWLDVSLQIEAPGSHIDFEAHGVGKEQSKIMLSVRTLAKISQRLKNCSTPLECQDVLSFMCSTLQRLVALPLPTPSVSYRSQITAACRHALVVHVFTRWCGHQPDPSLMVSMAQHDLLSILRQLMSHRGSSQLLLWLLSVCGAGFLGRAQRTWVLSQLADVLEDLEIKSWEKMLENLQQVMWHNYQDEQQQRELWVEVMWHSYQNEQQQRESWEEVMSKHEFTPPEHLLGNTGSPKLEDLWLAVLR